MNDVIEKAKIFATEAHNGQFRKYNGQPYITHPESVANYLSDLVGDEDMIAAAWLHDVVEDCEISVEELDKIFGKRIASLVGELTNPSKEYPYLRRADRKRMDCEHIAVISSEAKTIKAIDRIKNLMDMRRAEDDFKVLYAKESLKLAEALEQDFNPNLSFLLNELRSLCWRIIDERKTSSQTCL